MSQQLEFKLETEGEATFLLSPSVGTFSCSLPKGQLLVPGQVAGTLVTLGVSYQLVIPAACSGRIASEAFDRIHEPVGFGTRLYELEPIAEGLSFDAEAATADATGDLVVRSSHAGRFWHRPSPADDAFAKVGDVIEDGATIGLIEVMKTFTHVHYRAEAGLPARAVILRFLIDDGAEAENGAALIEVEAAS